MHKQALIMVTHAKYFILPALWMSSRGEILSVHLQFEQAVSTASGLVFNQCQYMSFRTLQYMAHTLDH